MCAYLHQHNDAFDFSIILIDAVAKRKKEDLITAWKINFNYRKTAGKRRGGIDRAP